VRVNRIPPFGSLSKADPGQEVTNQSCPTVPVPAIGAPEGKCERFTPDRHVGDDKGNTSRCGLGPKCPAVDRGGEAQPTCRESEPSADAHGVHRSARSAPVATGIVGEWSIFSDQRPRCEPTSASRSPTTEASPPRRYGAGREVKNGVGVWSDATYGFTLLPLLRRQES
jgi:hypothetical protein